MTMLPWHPTPWLLPRPPTSSRLPGPQPSHMVDILLLVLPLLHELCCGASAVWRQRVLQRLVVSMDGNATQHEMSLGSPSFLFPSGTLRPSHISGPTGTSQSTSGAWGERWRHVWPCAPLVCLCVSNQLCVVDTSTSPCWGRESTSSWPRRPSSWCLPSSTR